MNRYIGIVLIRNIAEKNVRAVPRSIEANSKEEAIGILYGRVDLLDTESVIGIDAWTLKSFITQFNGDYELVKK